MRNYIKVSIINLDSIGSGCGYGDGKTLAEAQANALAYASHNYPRGNARVSPNGWQVYVNAGA